MWSSYLVNDIFNMFFFMSQVLRNFSYPFVLSIGDISKLYVSTIELCDHLI